MLKNTILYFYIIIYICKLYKIFKYEVCICTSICIVFIIHPLLHAGWQIDINQLRRCSNASLSSLFLADAEMNYQVYALKQQKCIFSHLEGQKSKMNSTMLKSRCQQGSVLQEVPENNLLALLNRCLPPIRMHVMAFSVHPDNTKIILPSWILNDICKNFVM